MKIRFQADNDLDQRIIDAVMRLAPECDFKTAPEAGFHTGTPDPEVLRIAAEDDRVLVSHDLKTLPQHFGKFIERNISPGVIIIRQEVAIRDAALSSSILSRCWNAGRFHQHHRDCQPAVLMRCFGNRSISRRIRG